MSGSPEGDGDPQNQLRAHCWGWGQGLGAQLLRLSHFTGYEMEPRAAERLARGPSRNRVELASPGTAEALSYN